MTTNTMILKYLTLAGVKAALDNGGYNDNSDIMSAEFTGLHVSTLSGKTIADYHIQYKDDQSDELGLSDGVVYVWLDDKGELQADF